MSLLPIFLLPADFEFRFGLSSLSGGGRAGGGGGGGGGGGRI